MGAQLFRSRRRTPAIRLLAVDESEYHKLAAVEDRMWYFRALHAEIERRLVDTIGGGTASVLDAGCGTGGLIRRLTAKYPSWRWTGIDLSPVATALARTRVPAEATVVDGSITALPFEEATFDGVVSADVLYHVADDTAAMAEAFRVLKRGGCFVVNVPAYRWLWSYHDDAVHSQRRYTGAELRAKLRSAGFRDVRVTYRHALTLPLVVIRRKFLRPPREGSDVHLSSAPVEGALNGLMALERAWLRTFRCLPFGSSVFAVALK